MAKIKKRTLRWKASPSPQVAGYKLYWSETGSVDYDSDCIKLGNVTEIVLPDDVKEFAQISGPIELGITAVDELGNESDLITIKTPYQFKVPEAPAELRLESRNAAPDSADPLESGGEPAGADSEDEERKEAKDPVRIFDNRPDMANRNDLRHSNDANSPEDKRSVSVSHGMPHFIGQDE